MNLFLTPCFSSARLWCLSSCCCIQSCKCVEHKYKLLTLKSPCKACKGPECKARELQTMLVSGLVFWCQKRSFNGSGWKVSARKTGNANVQNQDLSYWRCMEAPHLYKSTTSLWRYNHVIFSQWKCSSYSFSVNLSKQSTYFIFHFISFECWTVGFNLSSSP